MSIACDSGLWTPPDISDLLIVTVDTQVSDSDFEGMLMANQAAIDWLHGRLDSGTYFDILDHVGIDPLGFVAEVEEHVNLLIAHG